MPGWSAQFSEMKPPTQKKDIPKAAVAAQVLHSQKETSFWKSRLKSNSWEFFWTYISWYTLYVYIYKNIYVSIMIMSYTNKSTFETQLSENFEHTAGDKQQL